MINKLTGLFTGRLVKAVAIVMVLAMITPLAACGRKGPPEFPEGSKYPHEYPAE